MPYDGAPTPLAAAPAAMYQHILFDLDGTLIDSADAILAGFRRVLDEHGLAPRVPLDRRLIGPALRPTLARLAGTSDEALVERLAQRFTAWYDGEGYRGSTVYPGIAELLAQLHAHGAHLHVVTNKRLRPTLLILEWLGWRPWFERVDTQDLRSAAPLASKTEVLGRLLDETGLERKAAIYVGDRIDDLQAATAQRLPCILVDWGYGALDVVPAETWRAATPRQLGTLLGLA